MSPPSPVGGTWGASLCDNTVKQRANTSWIALMLASSSSYRSNRSRTISKGSSVFIPSECETGEKDQKFWRQNHSSIKIRACKTAETKGGFAISIARSAISMELTMTPPEGCSGPCTASSLSGGLCLTLVPKGWEGTVTHSPFRMVDLFLSAARASVGLLTLLVCCQDQTCWCIFLFEPASPPRNGKLWAWGTCRGGRS